MKKLSLVLVVSIAVFTLNSCCKCMNCPGFAQSTGASSDVICQKDYENDPNTTMTWAQYSDYMIQTGCTCVQ